MSPARAPDFRVADVLAEIGLPNTWGDVSSDIVRSDFDSEEQRFKAYFAQELRGKFYGSHHWSGLTDARARSLYARLRDNRADFVIDYYTKIRLASEDGCCPYCGISRAGTVDHVLPKALYPWLSIVPLNLVPACSDCNNSWQDYDESGQGQKKFHPYLDFPEGRWLGVEVIESKVSPLAFAFYCDPPEAWDEENRQQIQNMFTVLRLGEVYASLSGAISVPLYSGLMRAGTATARQELLSGRSIDYGQLGPNNLTAVVCDQLLVERWHEREFPPFGQ